MTDKKLCQLAEFFPNRDFDSLKNALINCNGQVENATEMLLSFDTDSVWNGDNKTITTRGKGNKQTSHTPDTDEYHNSSMQYRTINSTNHNRSSSQTPIKSRFSSNSYKFKVYDDDDLVDNEDSYDPEYCRQKALEFMEKRNDAFRKASQSYQKTKGHRNGESGIAFHYSTEVRRF